MQLSPVIIHVISPDQSWMFPYLMSVLFLGNKDHVHALFALFLHHGFSLILVPSFHWFSLMTFWRRKWSHVSRADLGCCHVTSWLHFLSFIIIIRNYYFHDPFGGSAVCLKVPVQQLAPSSGKNPDINGLFQAPPLSPVSSEQTTFTHESICQWTKRWF